MERSEIRKTTLTATAAPPGTHRNSKVPPREWLFFLLRVVLPVVSVMRHVRTLSAHPKGRRKTQGRSHGRRGALSRDLPSLASRIQHDILEYLHHEM